MVCVPTGRHSCVTGIEDSANDNELPIPYTIDERWNWAEARFVAEEEMTVVRDPISGDWIIEDFAGETVLFHMPRDCPSTAVRRAVALYAAAFKSGFEQGRFVACSTNSVG